ncbi:MULTISPECIES: GntR family transcriptional regulator [Actinomadura]|uniref:GntR family transcriptional regulator n=1 Tax=Actinomadura yumaensis TaxID=111807 RepID=A0ABW2CE71_9ACTN|nr:GntR family transcriptional regulator [Actinomadura sp. J1-007]
MAIARLGQGVGLRPQLSDEVAARIRALIMDGRVRPGEYLRLERLALEFGISVTPVREALQSLRSEGFVHLEPRRGFVVAALSRQDVRDLFWVQATIAGELAARAAARLSPEALRDLRGLQRTLEQAESAGRIDVMEEQNHRFHRAINLAAGSAKLTWSLGSVARYAPRGLYGRLPDWPGLAVRDHRRILAALSAAAAPGRGRPDGPGARAAAARAAGTEMRRHIVGAGELLMGHLARQGMWRDEELDEVSD